MLNVFKPKSKSAQVKPSLEQNSCLVEEISETEQSVVSGGHHNKFLGEWIRYA